MAETLSTYKPESPCELHWRITTFYAFYGYAVLGDSTNIILGVLTLIGVVVGVAGTAWGIRRAKSGKIDTTEASDLWKEATGMRQALKEELTSVKDDMKVLKAENADLKADNAKWRQRFEDLDKEMITLREDNLGLRGRVFDLEQERKATHG